MSLIGCVISFLPLPRLSPFNNCSSRLNRPHARADPGFLHPVDVMLALLMRLDEKLPLPGPLLPYLNRRQLELGSSQAEAHNSNTLER